MLQEQQWVEEAKGGSQEAFACLVRAYEKRVYALTRRMCPTPEDAAEAAQEAFLAAWQGLPNFRGDAAFSTWLYRLASNACVDILRKESRRGAAEGPSLDDEAVPIDPPDRAPTPQEAVERRELREEIEAGLAALPAEYRQPLVLREIHQLSYQEIAQAMDLDLGTVKSRISRGRRRLREILLQSGNFSAGRPSKLAEGKSGKEGRK
ncbi:MAG: sigma-70 family RNA polymerase sigma factor [Oscillibacter sp.]|nr:sigma-70 family RNA polymerase sigma factor [Oscillibacter sp.]